MADAVQITTWIGVTASAISGVVAVVTVYLRTKTKEKIAAIDRGTPDAARIVADAVASFHLNTADLTKEQIFLLARDEIAARDKKHARSFLVLISLTIVLAVTTVVLAVLAREEPSSFNVTVRLRLPNATPATKGTVTIFYGDTARSEPVNPNGEANFKDIPAKYRLSTTAVKLRSSSYELIAPEKRFSLSDSPINVLVRHNEEYLTGYKDGFAIGKIRKALKEYRQIRGVYPDSLRELTTDFGQKEWVDWLGNRVSYRTDSALGYILRFAGQDGIMQTADDNEFTATTR